jgi:hypothetical protein
MGFSGAGGGACIEAAADRYRLTNPASMDRHASGFGGRLPAQSRDGDIRSARWS